MNFGGWGVQAFITYFFISYIYYVLFIKRVYENHMIMCDGYIMLTFFISTHLINRNNCVASKLTYIYSVCTTSRFVEDFLRGPARRVCGQPMRERSSHRHDRLTRYLLGTELIQRDKTRIADVSLMRWMVSFWLKCLLFHDTALWL